MLIPGDASIVLLRWVRLFFVDGPGRPRWCRWYSRVVEVTVRIEVAAGFVAPGASEPPRLQPSSDDRDRPAVALNGGLVGRPMPAASPETTVKSSFNELTHQTSGNYCIFYAFAGVQGPVN